MRALQIVLGLMISASTVFAKDVVYQRGFPEVTRRSGGERLDGRFSKSVQESLIIHISPKGYKVEIHDVIVLSENGKEFDKRDIGLLNQFPATGKGSVMVNPGETASVHVSLEGESLYAYEVVAESWGGYADLDITVEAGSGYVAPSPVDPVYPEPPAVDCRQDLINAQSAETQCLSNKSYESQRYYDIQRNVDYLKIELEKQSGPLMRCEERRGIVNTEVSSARAELEDTNARAHQLKRENRYLDDEIREMRQAKRGASYECELISRHHTTYTATGSTLGEAMFKTLDACPHTACGKKEWNPNIRCYTVKAKAKPAVKKKPAKKQATNLPPDIVSGGLTKEAVEVAQKKLAEQKQKAAAQAKAKMRAQAQAKAKADALKRVEEMKKKIAEAAKKAQQQQKKKNSKTKKKS